MYEGSAPDMPPQHLTPGSAKDNFTRIISVEVTDETGWIGAAKVPIIVRTYSIIYID